MYIRKGADHLSRVHGKPEKQTRPTTKRSRHLVVQTLAIGCRWGKSGFPRSIIPNIRNQFLRLFLEREIIANASVYVMSVVLLRHIHQVIARLFWVVRKSSENCYIFAHIIASKGKSPFYIIDTNNKKFILPVKDSDKFIYFCLGNTRIKSASIDLLNIIYDKLNKIDISLAEILGE